MSTVYYSFEWSVIRGDCVQVVHFRNAHMQITELANNVFIHSRHNEHIEGMITSCEDNYYNIEILYSLFDALPVK